MPVYNREEYLDESLSSVAAQNYINWQLVIVDDGSTDGSMEVAKQFANDHINKCKIISSAVSRSGAAACRNIGTAHADGGYIIFLDSDDKLENFCLQQRIKVMNENPELDWAVFKQYKWEPEKKPPYNLFSKSIATKEEAINFFLEMDPPWQTMAAIWKKNALQLLNGFDEKLIYMEDPDLHLRALLHQQLKGKLLDDLPADNFYRVDNMEANKQIIFYQNSIQSRFVFLQKLVNSVLPSGNESGNKMYAEHIRIGFLKFLKQFVLARAEEYSGEIQKTINLLYNAKVISWFDVIKIKRIVRIFLSSSSLVRSLKLKGIAYRFI